MKRIVLILLLAPLFIFSQENDKNEKASFEVLGMCGMCKNRIEKATYKVKGVKYSNWDIPSNKISIKNRFLETTSVNRVGMALLHLCLLAPALMCV